MVDTTELRRVVEAMTLRCNQCNKPQQWDGSGLCSWRAAEPVCSCDGSQTVEFKRVEIERLAYEIDRLRANCPCAWTDPCTANCSCANPALSGGCSRCCKYGDDAQRKAAAACIAARDAELARLRQQLDAKDREIEQLKNDAAGWESNAREVAGNCAEYLTKLADASDQLAAARHAMEILPKFRKLAEHVAKQFHPVDCLDNCVVCEAQSALAAQPQESNADAT